MLLAWMIIAQLLWAASVLLWLPMFAMSFMSFDMGISLGPVVFVSVLGVYPLIALGASIWGWIAYRRKQNRRAAWVMAIPFAYILIFLLVIQIGIWLES